MPFARWALAHAVASGVEMKKPNSKMGEALAVEVRSSQHSGLLEQRLVSFG